MPDSGGQLVDVISRTYQASFKGAAFVCDSVSTAGGRKIAIHNFPNADFLAVEDLGMMPRRFSVQATIHNSSASEASLQSEYIGDYYNRKARLLSALEEGGTGTFFHPFFGAIEGVSAVTYSLDENLQAVGMATITMDFVIAQNLGLQFQLSSEIFSVATSRTQKALTLKEAFVQGYSVSKKFVTNQTDAIKNATKVADDALAAMNAIHSEIDAANVMVEQVGAFKENIYTLINEPEALWDQMSDFFSNAEDLFLNRYRDQSKYHRDFKTFGDDFEVSDSETAEIIERNKNNAALSNTVKGLSYIYSAEAATNFEFLNDIDIENESAAIYEQYTEIFNNPLETETVKNQMTVYYNEVDGILSNEALTVDKVVDIKIQTMPVSVLNYMLYGDQENVRNLIGLNGDANVSYYSGNKRVLTND